MRENDAWTWGKVDLHENDEQFSSKIGDGNPVHPMGGGGGVALLSFKTTPTLGCQ